MELNQMYNTKDNKCPHFWSMIQLKQNFLNYNQN